jgi:hypothetical protein
MKNFFSILLFLTTLTTFSQVKVGENPNNVNNSALFEMESTSKGFLPPRMTTAQRDAIQNPALGLQIFNLTTNCLEIFIAPNWQNVFCGCSSAPANLSYTDNGPITYCLNTGISPNSATTQASTPSSFTVSPSLPAGLQLNNVNGQITGTPTTTATAANYTITASNACGSTTRVLNIVVTVPPSNLSYTNNGPLSFCTNALITANNPSSLGGVPTTYSTAPSLPSSLSINGVSGQISGTPSVATASSNYTITASNTCGSTSRILNIQVNATPNQPVLSSNSPVIIGSSINLTSSSTVGATYNWTGPNSFASSSQNPTIQCTNTANQGSYNATVTLNGCTSPISSINVTVNPLSSSTIAGQSLWLDAASITSVSNNTQISSWLDLSGNNRNATSTNWPTYISNGINGKPVLQFTTAQNISVNHNFPNPYTVIYVAKQTSGSRQRVLSSINNNWLLGWWGHGGGGAKSQAFFDGWVSAAGNPPADNNVYLYTGTSTGNQSFLYENGVLLYNNGNGVTGPNGLAINAGAHASEASTCQIAEIIVYNSSLSQPNRQLVENYLKCKWGIP